MHHGFALRAGERCVIDAQHIHFNARGDQRHIRSQVLRHARCGVQGNRQPDLLDIIVGQTVGLEECFGSVGAIDFEALVVSAMTLHQTQVMEHRADVQQFWVVAQLLAFAAQGTEQKHPARVVIQQV
jgi:hypothetical protein